MDEEQEYVYVVFELSDEDIPVYVHIDEEFVKQDIVRLKEEALAFGYKNIEYHYVEVPYLDI